MFANPADFWPVSPVYFKSVRTQTMLILSRRRDESRSERLLPRERDDCAPD